MIILAKSNFLTSTANVNQKYTSIKRCIQIIINSSLTIYYKHGTISRLNSSCTGRAVIPILNLIVMNI